MDDYGTEVQCEIDLETCQMVFYALIAGAIFFVPDKTQLVTHTIWRVSDPRNSPLFALCFVNPANNRCLDRTEFKNFEQDESQNYSGG